MRKRSNPKPETVFDYCLKTTSKTNTQTKQQHHQQVELTVLRKKVMFLCDFTVILTVILKLGGFTVKTQNLVGQYYNVYVCK